MERLTELYWEIFQEEGPIELEEFLKQLTEGKHGEYAPEEIGDFLDEMLETMLANIRIKASEAPHYEAMREQVEADTAEKIARLKEKYAAG